MCVCVSVCMCAGVCGFKHIRKNPSQRSTSLPVSFLFQLVTCNMLPTEHLQRYNRSSAIACKTETHALDPHTTAACFLRTSLQRYTSMFCPFPMGTDKQSTNGTLTIDNPFLINPCEPLQRANHRRARDEIEAHLCQTPASWELKPWTRAAGDKSDNRFLFF